MPLEKKRGMLNEENKTNIEQREIEQELKKSGRKKKNNLVKKNERR